MYGCTGVIRTVHIQQATFSVTPISFFTLSKIPVGVIASTAAQELSGIFAFFGGIDLFRIIFSNHQINTYGILCCLYCTVLYSSITST